MHDVLLIACKHNGWAVDPFLSLFNKFWPNITINIVAERNYATVDGNYKFIQLPNDMIVNGECPKGKFSNSLIFGLKSVPGEYVTVMLSDYWPYADVDVKAIDDIENYMKGDQNILRVDTGSQYIPKNLQNLTPNIFGPIDNRNCFYPVSLCPAMWNKTAYLSLLRDGWDPWQTESLTCDRFLGHKSFGDKFKHLRSLWYHPGPIKYHNALRARDDTSLVARRETIDIVKHLIPPRFKIVFEN